jgi:hypothetical protein
MMGSGNLCNRRRGAAFNCGHIQQISSLTETICPKIRSITSTSHKIIRGRIRHHSILRNLWLRNVKPIIKAAFVDLEEFGHSSD